MLVNRRTGEVVRALIVSTLLEILGTLSCSQLNRDRVLIVSTLLEILVSQKTAQDYRSTSIVSTLLEILASIAIVGIAKSTTR